MNYPMRTRPSLAEKKGQAKKLDRAMEHARMNLTHSDIAAILKQKGWRLARERPGGHSSYTWTLRGTDGKIMCHGSSPAATLQRGLWSEHDRTHDDKVTRYVPADRPAHIIDK